MMNDRDWHVTEHGTVVRRYFHATGASREMATAQEAGWDVQEVTLNGEQVPESPPRKGLGLRLPPTRLERAADGKLRLRTRGSGGHVGWHTQGRGIPAFDLVITYVRN